MSEVSGSNAILVTFGEKLKGKEKVFVKMISGRCEGEAPVKGLLWVP